MKNGRKSVTISLYQEHLDWLKLVGDPAELGPSEVVRSLIESFYDARFVKTFFGYELKRPAWREEQKHD